MPQELDTPDRPEGKRDARLCTILTKGILTLTLTLTLTRTLTLSLTLTLTLNPTLSLTRSVWEPSGRSPWQEPIGPEPLATADLRGSVNVVTGVGTLQHLYCAFGTRRSTAHVGTDPLGGLPVEPGDLGRSQGDLARSREVSGEHLSARLMSNAHQPSGAPSVDAHGG